MRKFLFTFVFMLFLSLPFFPEENKEVTINFSWVKAPGFGSNQCAVWIEDESGDYVKTLYVSKFTGRGGFLRRQDSLVNWREKAEITTYIPKDIDSVTSATPKNGNKQIVWDLTDFKGNKVKQGVYLYKVEGTLYFSEYVVWTGKIDLTKDKDSSNAESIYNPVNTDKKNITVVKVSAEYK